MLDAAMLMRVLSRGVDILDAPSAGRGGEKAKEGGGAALLIGSCTWCTVCMHLDVLVHVEFCSMIFVGSSVRKALGAMLCRFFICAESSRYMKNLQTRRKKQWF